MNTTLTLRFLGTVAAEMGALVAYDGLCVEF